MKKKKEEKRSDGLLNLMKLPLYLMIICIGLYNLALDFGMPMGFKVGYILITIFGSILFMNTLFNMARS